MKKTLARSLMAAAALGALALGALSLLVPATMADVENPCDPVFGVLKACRDAHGHWDYKCCCCKTH